MPDHLIEAHGQTYTIHAEEGSLIDQNIIERGVYEPWLLEHVWELDLHGTAIDVGAHIGNHTLWFALVCKLSVIAFEPLFYEELRHNVAINDGNPGAYAIRVEPCALGAVAGRASDGGERVLSAPGAPRGPGTAEGRLTVGDGAVRVETLDSFELTDVVLIKIDVEGMEPDVLRGAVDTIEREHPIIVAETQTPQAEAESFSVLEPLGYHRTAHWRRGTPITKWEHR